MLEVSKKVFLLAVLLSWGTAFAAPTPKPNNVLKLIKDAEDLFLKNDRAIAAQILRKELPKLSPAEQKNLREKISQFEIAFYTDKGLQLYELGKELLKADKPTEANAKLSEANVLEKGNGAVLNYLAIAYIKSKNYSQAEAIISEAREKWPENTDHLKNQLLLDIKNSSWSEALKVAEKLIGECKDSSSATVGQKGWALYNLGNLLEAKKHLLQAAAADKTDADPYYWLFQITNIGDKKRYLDSYLKICKGDPKPVKDRSAVGCDEAENISKN